MKTILTFALTLFTTLIFADSHIIIKQNGEKIEANYVTTKNNSIFYSLPGTSVLSEMSLFAVEKIIDKKTSKVLLSNKKIAISGKSGYKNVAFLEKSQINGLKEGATLSTMAHKPKGQTKSDWIAQAKTRIRKQAAEQGFPFVLITSLTHSKMEVLTYNY